MQLTTAIASLLATRNNAIVASPMCICIMHTVYSSGSKMTFSLRAFSLQRTYGRPLLLLGLYWAHLGISSHDFVAFVIDSSIVTTTI
jgi:hypothetical protein